MVRALEALLLVEAVFFGTAFFEAVFLEAVFLDDVAFLGADFLTAVFFTAVFFFGCVAPFTFQANTPNPMATNIGRILRISYQFTVS